MEKDEFVIGILKTGPITNADRIRAMSDEELVAELRKITVDCPPGESWDECPKDRGIRTTCYDCWMKYLRQPAEGGEQDV